DLCPALANDARKLRYQLIYNDKLRSKRITSRALLPARRLRCGWFRRTPSKLAYTANRHPYWGHRVSEPLASRKTRAQQDHLAPTSLNSSTPMRSHSWRVHWIRVVADHIGLRIHAHRR